MQRDIGVSLMPRDAVPVLEPVMLMLAWYIVMGGLRTASLAAFQVVLFRVALFYDTMRSHYRSDNCSLRLEAASCASFTTGAKWIRRNTLEHVFINESVRNRVTVPLPRAVPWWSGTNATHSPPFPQLVRWRLAAGVISVGNYY